jgi:hypothetical protein
VFIVRRAGRHCHYVWPFTNEFFVPSLGPRPLRVCFF